MEDCLRVLLDTSSHIASLEQVTHENFLCYNRVRNMTDVARQMVIAALERESSLGAHCIANPGQCERLKQFA